jgi:hypothetical protein
LSDLNKLIDFSVICVIQSPPVQIAIELSWIDFPASLPIRGMLSAKVIEEKHIPKIRKNQRMNFVINFIK